MEFYEKLYQALKNDDIKAFRSCMDETHCGSVRLGRFPVLSVMYLYNARRLLRAYEKSFLKHNSWRDVGEPLELSAKFRSIAGKCLRIYLKETVSPVEMLLLLNNDFKAKKVYRQSRVTPPVKQRLKDIYYVRWGLQAQFVRDQIVLERRPLTYAEKLRWLTRALCIAMCVVLVVASPFVVNVISPFIAEDGVLNVSRWSQIRFRSDGVYVLQSDVTVPSRFFAKEMNCTLIGNGHTVTIEGGEVFGNLNGKISDVTFETNGAPIAESVTLQTESYRADGKIYTRRKVNVENVTVNTTVNAQTESSLGFFANENYGVITDVVVNVSGSLTATAPAQPSEETEDPVFGGVVALNGRSDYENNDLRALVQNCTVNFDGFTLAGQLEANAMFGGVVGRNYAHVQDCQANGSISADTFDLAGICGENDYGVIRCVNNANVFERCSLAEWSPLVAGIVAVNNMEVYACENRGNVTGIGEELAVVGGIVARAYGNIFNSVNTGDVSADSQVEAHVGGIVGATCYGARGCYSAGNVKVNAASCLVGGIVGYAFGWHYGHSPLYCGYAINCISESVIQVTTKTSSDSLVAVGGIVGLAEEWKVSYTDDSVVYMCGEIYNCYFLGSLQADPDSYVGGIAGIVGQTVYETSNNPNSEQTSYFDGNFYLLGCGVGYAYGATVPHGTDNYRRLPTDVGAASASRAQIEADEIYQQILALFADDSV